MRFITVHIERALLDLLHYGRRLVDLAAGYVGHEIGPAPFILAGVLVGLVGMLILHRRY